MPWLSDEKLEGWEDPADRRPRTPERTVPRENQLAMRFAKEDSRLKSLERKALPLLDRVMRKGNHRLSVQEFNAVVSYLFSTMPRERTTAIRERFVDLGRGRTITAIAAAQEAA